MPRLVAFLRAINVNGRYVKMGTLRALFEALEIQNVETLIASGNVIFEAPDADADAQEHQIERHLHASLGYEVATFLRSPSELAAVARYEPFPADELDAAGTQLYIAFLAAPPDIASQNKLMTYRNEVDDIDVHKREIYWLCRRQLGASTFAGAQLEKVLGMPATLRNATTVKKLAAKYAAAP